MHGISVPTIDTTTHHKRAILICYAKKFGAGGGTRTHTGLGPNRF